VVKTTSPKARISALMSGTSAQSAVVQIVPVPFDFQGP